MNRISSVITRALPLFGAKRTVAPKRVSKADTSQDTWLLWVNRVDTDRQVAYCGGYLQRHPGEHTEILHLPLTHPQVRRFKLREGDNLKITTGQTTGIRNEDVMEILRVERLNPKRLRQTERVLFENRKQEDQD